MAASTISGGRWLALLALATGAIMVTFYIRRSLRNRRRRRADGDDDSGVDLDVGSELSLREDDVTTGDAENDVIDATSIENQESAPAATCRLAAKPTKSHTSTHDEVTMSDNKDETSAKPKIEFTDDSTASACASEGVHVVDESDGLIEYKSKAPDTNSSRSTEPEIILNQESPVARCESVPVEASIDFLSIPRAPPPTRNVSQCDLNDNTTTPARTNTIEDLVNQGKGGLPSITPSAEDRMGRMHRRDGSDIIEDTQDNLDDIVETSEEDMGKPQQVSSVTEKMGCLAASKYDTMSFEVIKDKAKLSKEQPNICIQVSPKQEDGLVINETQNRTVPEKEFSSDITNSSEAAMKDIEIADIVSQKNPKINLDACEDRVEDIEKEIPKAPPPSRCMSREFTEKERAAALTSEELSLKLMMANKETVNEGKDSTSLINEPSIKETIKETMDEKQKCDEDSNDRTAQNSEVLLHRKDETRDYPRIVSAIDAKKEVLIQEKPDAATHKVDNFRKSDSDNSSGKLSESTAEDSYIEPDCEDEIPKAPPPSRCMSKESFKQEQTATDISEELSQKLLKCHEESGKTDTKSSSLAFALEELPLKEETYESTTKDGFSRTSDIDIFPGKLNVEDSCNEPIGDCGDDFPREPPPSRCVSKESFTQERTHADISEELSQKLLMCQEESFDTDIKVSSSAYPLEEELHLIEEVCESLCKDCSSKKSNTDYITENLNGNDAEKSDEDYEEELPKEPPPSRCVSKEYFKQEEMHSDISEELSQKLTLCHEESVNTEMLGTLAHNLEEEDLPIKETITASTQKDFGKSVVDKAHGKLSISTAEETWEGPDLNSEDEIPEESQKGIYMSQEPSKQEQSHAGSSEQLSHKLHMCNEDTSNTDTKHGSSASDPDIDESHEVNRKEDIEEDIGNKNDSKIAFTLFDESSPEETTKSASPIHGIQGQTDEEDSENENDIETVESTRIVGQPCDNIETSILHHHKPIFNQDDEINSNNNGSSSSSSPSHKDTLIPSSENAKSGVDEENIMVDGGESQAFSDICEADGPIASSSTEELLSEVAIFGRLPPPYGYEETATSFGADAEGKDPATVAFSPPSGFKDWENGGDSDEDIEVIRVRPNSCNTPLTYSIVNNYDSRLYTHYEETEEDIEADGDSKHSGSTSGKTDTETMDSLTLVFDLDEIHPEGDHVSISALEESGLREDHIINVAHFGSGLSHSEEVQHTQLAEMGVYMSGADIVVLDDDISESEEAGAYLRPESTHSNEADLSPDSIDGSERSISPDSMDSDSLCKDTNVIFDEVNSNDNKGNSRNSTVVSHGNPDNIDTAGALCVYKAPETAFATPETASVMEYQKGPVAGVSPSDAETTLNHVSEQAGSMTSMEAEVLTSLLTTSDDILLQRTLVTIGNAAAFTKNQNLLREAGCLKQLIHLLQIHEMALRVGQSVTYPAVVTRVVNTVTNLAVNEENQKQLQDCIPALIDFAKCASAPESVQVSSLQALTNLSVTSSYHPPYTKLIQHLYECLDNGSKNIQLHALKVLVNLSSNPEMVPHLLAAKAPSSLLSIIVPRTDEDLLLRWVTFLANVMWTSREKSLTSTSLPTEYKAASPETMWTALYGLNNSVHLRSKVFVLSKHKHESVRYHAARIYSCLT